MGSDPQDSGMVLMDLKTSKSCLANSNIYRLRENAVVSLEERLVKPKYPTGGLRNLSTEFSISSTEAIIEVLLR